MAILSHLSEKQRDDHEMPVKVHLLYSTRLDRPVGENGEDEKQGWEKGILFLTRLRRIFALWSQEPPESSPSVGLAEKKKVGFKLDLHLTSLPPPGDLPEGVVEGERDEAGFKVLQRRITRDDLDHALGDDGEEKKTTVVYVCGPQGMTDDMVDYLEGEAGMTGRVLCEKWW